MENQKQQALVLREQAKQQLMEIKTVDEAVTYINKVKAIETYCKAVKEDNEIVKMVAEQKIRSMRLAGQMLQQTDISSNYKSNLPDGNKGLPTEKPTLSDLGLTKNESSTYQKIASIPNDVFEEKMEEAKQGDSTRDISVSKFKNLNSDNSISIKLDAEKQFRKYAKQLGFKMEYLTPDLIVCYKHNSDINNIKQIY